MIFNVFLANQPPQRLKKLYDLLRPIENGLTECGHHVIGYGLGLLPAPAVNLVVEFFPDDPFVDSFLKLKTQSGDRLILGVLSPDDIEDADAMDVSRYPRRRANLERVLAVADFAWTLLPQVPLYEAICGAGNAALVTFGFSERLLNRRLITTPELRDLDVVIDGDETPRRREIVAALEGHGLKCRVSGGSPLPGFATADLARRAKIFLDARRTARSRFSSPRRICKGLHNGALVVTERAGEPSILDGFAAGCDPAGIVEHCVAIVRSGMAVSLGLSALEKFRRETSMRAGLLKATRLPVFQRLGA